MAQRNRLIFWAILATVLAMMALWAFWPRPVAVDIVEVRTGSMEVTVSEEGETRVRDVFEIYAPVGGQLERIELEAGDCVYAGRTVVAAIRPAAAPILDTRSEARLEAAEQAASAAVQAARADLERVRAELGRAADDLVRAQRLAETGTLSSQALERAETEVSTLEAAERAGEASLAMRRQELAMARAALRPSGAEGEGELIDVMAPIDGVVLRRLRESEGPVQQGAPLVAVGDPQDIEIVADLLSEDAVRVSEGDRVLIRDWGGPELMARVRRIEPFAFTKVSALGIEEQRVNVVIDLLGRQPGGRLGHGYRVDVAIEVWSAPDVLSAPMTALFKQDGQWAVYRVTNGRARLTPVGVGQMNFQHAQILAGLEEGDRVIEHPSNRVEEGVRVEGRTLSAPEPAFDDTMAVAEPAETDPVGPGGCDARDGGPVAAEMFELRPETGPADQR